MNFLSNWKLYKEVSCTVLAQIKPQSRDLKQKSAGKLVVQS